MGKYKTKNPPTTVLNSIVILSGPGEEIALRKGGGMRRIFAEATN